MSGLITFTRLPPVERSLALHALLLVGVIRIGVWTLPFRRLQNLFDLCKWLPFSVSPETPVNRLVWAVLAASKRIPAATCLTQSLALHSLLDRSGYDSKLHIGVARDADTGFQAHAWVEQGGQIWLSSRSDTARYVQVFSWEARRA